MPHLIEPAPTGRAMCRGCGRPVPKGSLRLGEVVPNLFAEGDGAETRQWYHLACGAYRRPEAFLDALTRWTEPLDGRETLEAEARLGLAHPRLPRLDQANRAASGRAACRACRTPIAKGEWRLSLVFWQDGRFVPAGFIHVPCAAGYLETTAILDRVRYFTPDLPDADVAEIAAALAAPPPAPLVAEPSS
jgi:hypothetical protein